MDKVNTTKELLSVLVTKITDLDKKVDSFAKVQFDMSLDISILKNQQVSDKKYFKGLLEGNDKTHQKGVVENLSDTMNDVSTLKTHQKVTAGKIGLAGFIFAAIGTVLLKVLGVIKVIL